MRDHTEPPPTYPGSEVLRGESADEVAEELLDGDPLGLVPRVYRALLEGAHYLDPERLVAEVVETVAERALSYRGVPDLDQWLEQCLGDAIARLVAEQRTERDTAWPAKESPSAELYRGAAAVLRQPENLAKGRLVCILLNGLPDDERIAFSDSGRGVPREETAARLGVPPERIEVLVENAKRSIEGPSDSPGANPVP